MQKEGSKKEEILQEEGDKMATITKPSVFEIKVTEQTKKRIMDKLNEVRLTKSFFDECAEISKRLRKEQTNEE